MNTKESNKIKLSEQNQVKKKFNLLLVISIIVFSFSYLRIQPWKVIASFPTLLPFFFQNFFPPNFANINLHFSAVLDTLLFAIVATYISSFLAFLLGILMSENVNPFPLLRGLIRFFVSFLRNVPVLIWVFLLIFIFGVGNLVGLLALVLSSLGFLARSYSESIDEIVNQRLESLQGMGASQLQILIHGIIPEFIPAWVNWTLFSFEINIRASAMLGMVGAGGIGFIIQTHLNLRNFREASSLILILIAMVLLTEFFVNLIRKKLNL